MLKNYFSVGEVAKIFNLSIKTLRYYDEIGLLKPSYVDKDTKYRYYSVDQFVLIDIIRNSKGMGLSLKEIKEIVSKDTETEDISALLGKQIEVINLKMKEMARIKSSMEEIYKLINNISKIKKNTIFISKEEERYCKVYPFVSYNIKEQEINFRKALTLSDLSLEVYAVFGCTTDADSYLKKEEFIYKDIRYYLNSYRDVKNISKLPKGKYLTIIFDDNSFNKEKYYKKLKMYIEVNKIEIEEDFIEEWIIPRLENLKESTLVKLQIKIKD